MKKSDEFLSLRAKLTLIEPEFGPWGPERTPKVVSIWGYFLDFSLDLKLDPIIKVRLLSQRCKYILNPGVGEQAVMWRA